MKKVALLFFGVLTLSLAAQAQFGVKIGANLTNLAGEYNNSDTYKNKLGLVAGLTYNVPLSNDNFLSIQPELLYSKKGYELADKTVVINGIQYKYEGKVKYSYLDLPILLKINAGPVFFEAGPQLSYLLTIKDNTEVTVNGQVFESYIPRNKDALAELEVGYAAGLGYMTQYGFSFGLRYNGSITSLAKNNNDELANARNSVIQATVGLKLSTVSK